MVSFKCKECSFATGRSYNLRRHLKNVHGVAKSTVVNMKTSDGTSQLGDRPPKRPRIQEPDDGVYTNKEYEETMDTLDGSSQLGDGLPRRQPRADPEDGLYTKEEYEETMASLRARFPTMNFDTIDSEIHAPVHGHHCWTIQFGKVNVLYETNTQCSRVYCSSTRTYSVLLQRIPTYIRPISQRRVCRGTTGFETCLTESNIPCSSLMTSCTKPTTRLQSYSLEYPTTRTFPSYTSPRTYSTTINTTGQSL